jgi:hypothetical protein
MSKTLHFRVSEWEFRKLKERASNEGLTVSDYIRERLKASNNHLSFNEAIHHLERDIIMLHWAMEKLEDFVCACVRVCFEGLKQS